MPVVANDANDYGAGKKKKRPKWAAKNHEKGTRGVFINRQVSSQYCNLLIILTIIS